MASNINPTLAPTKSLNNFRFWCQKVLPLVYDDSLSYYEVLGKMVVQLNDVIDNVNADTENVLTLKDAFLELQTYVNNFFDDIDQLASYAERAETAQTAANQSAINAASSASNASASSLAAMDAKDAAVAARQAAETSANTASTAATNANTKASEAAQSAITAQTAQASASQSATLAATDRSAAQTAASTAITKANEASTSATNAEASASDAEQSKTEAEALVNEVQESLDNIQQNTQNISKLIEFYPTAILPLNKYSTGQNSSVIMKNETVQIIRTISGTFNLTGGIVTRYTGVGNIPLEDFNIKLSANTRIKLKLECLEDATYEREGWIGYIQLAKDGAGIVASRVDIDGNAKIGSIKETYFTVEESGNYALYMYQGTQTGTIKFRLTIEAVSLTANTANTTTAMLLENM